MSSTFISSDIAELSPIEVFIDTPPSRDLHTMSYPISIIDMQKDTKMPENNEQQETIVKDVVVKQFYSTAEIANVFGVSQSRVRQVRLKLELEPTEFAGAKLHTQSDFEAIAEYFERYSNIRVNFITQDA